MNKLSSSDVALTFC